MRHQSDLKISRKTNLVHNYANFGLELRRDPSFKILHNRVNPPNPHITSQKSMPDVVEQLYSEYSSRENLDSYRIVFKASPKDDKIPEIKNSENLSPVNTHSPRSPKSPRDESPIPESIHENGTIDPKEKKVIDKNKMKIIELSLQNKRSQSVTVRRLNNASPPKPVKYNKRMPSIVVKRQDQLLGKDLM